MLSKLQRKAYSNSNQIQSTKDLKYVAEELASIIVESRHNISYLAEVADAETYIAMQTPVCSDGEKTSFYLGNNYRTTMYNSKEGTTIYNYINAKTFNITNYKTDVAVNDEGWTPFSIIIRSSSAFNNFYIKNSNIIALKANLNIENQNLIEFCRDNTQLRTVKMSTNAKYMNNAFDGCNNLMNCEVNAQITDANEMLLNCSSLLNLKVDLSQCEFAIDMLKNCTNLQTIDVGGSLGKITEFDLSYCTKMTVSNVVAFLNSLEKNEGDMKTVYIPINTLSNAQKIAFRNKGYNPVYKPN